LQRKIIDINTYFGTYPRRKTDLSLSLLTRLMEQNGVSKAATVSMKGILYDYVEGNAETLASCRNNEGLIPAATVDPRKFTGDADDLKLMADQGFGLLRLFPDYQGWPPRFAPVRSTAEALQDTGMPLMVNILTYGTATEFVDMVGDFGIPLILSGIGYWTLSEAISLMKSNERVFVETSHLDSPDAIEVLVERVGPKRLVFGSNAPVTYFKSAYLTVAKSEVPDEEKDMIFHLNAEGILGGRTT